MSVLYTGMNTFIIYNESIPETKANAEDCLQSFSRFSGWAPELFDGCSPDTLNDYISRYGVKQGMRTKHREENNLWASKFSCFYSHYAIWVMCYENNEPVAIVENDTRCIGDYNVEFDHKSNTIIQLTLESMINPLKGVNPHTKRGRLQEYDDIGEGMHKIWFEHPHGEVYLAGATGYIITPKAAKVLIDDCTRNGWTQNDLLISANMMELLFVNPSPIEYVKSKEKKTSSRIYK